MSRIRIIIADDHPVVRDGLCGMLESQPDFEL
jgi:DNA-binding NarL/FixJ family response regulator